MLASNICFDITKESIEITVKDSHFISLSGTFKPQKLI